MEARGLCPGLLTAVAKRILDSPAQSKDRRQSFFSFLFGGRQVVTEVVSLWQSRNISATHSSDLYFDMYAASFNLDSSETFASPDEALILELRVSFGSVLPNLCSFELER